MDFNPNSIDAQFQKLHTSFEMHMKDRNERSDRQDVILREIVQHTKETNGRVTALEGKWKSAAGWIAGASAVFILVVQMFLHFWK